MQKSNENKSKLSYVKNINYSQLKVAVIFVSIVGLGLAGYVINQRNARIAASQISVPTANAEEIPGWWMQENFELGVCDAEYCSATADPDNDKLTNYQEFYYHTDPYDTDSNDNGKLDGEDVALNIDPSKKGNVTFEQAMSDENILGESLAFADEIETEFKESIDISKVDLKLPTDEELRIGTSSNDKSTYEAYMKNVDDTVAHYFSDAQLQNVDQFIASASLDSQMQIKAYNLARDLRKIAVPLELVTLHKYTIAFYELLPVVLDQPTPEEIKDTTNAKANDWFVKAQSFLALVQKMDFEVQRLQIN